MCCVGLLADWCVVGGGGVDGMVVVGRGGWADGCKRMADGPFDNCRGAYQVKHSRNTFFILSEYVCVCLFMYSCVFMYMSQYLTTCSHAYTFYIDIHKILIK